MSEGGRERGRERERKIERGRGGERGRDRGGGRGRGSRHLSKVFARYVHTVAYQYPVLVLCSVVKLSV